MVIIINDHYHLTTMSITYECVSAKFAYDNVLEVKDISNIILLCSPY